MKLPVRLMWPDHSLVYISHHLLLGPRITQALYTTTHPSILWNQVESIRHLHSLMNRTPSVRLPNLRMQSMFRELLAIWLCFAALGVTERFPVQRPSLNNSLRILSQNDTQGYLFKVPAVAGDPDTDPLTIPSTDPSDPPSDKPMSDAPSPDTDPAVIEAVWQKAKCNGEKLYQAMIRSPDQTANFIPATTYDGNMQTELDAWDYSDRTGDPYYDAHCDFTDGIDRHPAFDAMGIDKRPSTAGGPNKCFCIEHYNGGKVKRQPPDYKMPTKVDHRYYGPDGKEYRVSQSPSSS